MKKGVYFVTGIDTDAGKTYATGVIAKMLIDKGESVITQKFIQTGCEGISTDIMVHREIMGTGLLDVDKSLLTSPEIYSYPCSPHLAAEIDKRPIDLAKINAATEQLAKSYEIVLVEGAGGLMVPLTRGLLTIDYINQMDYPVVFVTSGKLGSINHTLLSLEACKSRGIQVAVMAYNMFPDTDEIIGTDTYNYLMNYMQMNFPDTEIVDIPKI